MTSLDQPLRHPETVATAPAATRIIHLSDLDTYENVDLHRGSWNDATGRLRVTRDEATQGHTAVILIFGQSNGANSGEGRYTPRPRVFNLNLFDGQCYAAQDPLLGATEDRGNFASRMADMLIERRVFDSVVLVPTSVGGSRIEEWTPGGARHRRLQVAIQRAREFGLVFSHLLWHQGESNAGPDADFDRYLNCLQDIHASLRQYGVTAPLYIAQATICDSAPNEIIRSAQRSAVDPALGILAGPDTDTIGFEHRFDNCHMNEAGLTRHAAMWADILSAEHIGDWR
jgi:hypothetical protein